MKPDRNAFLVALAGGAWALVLEGCGGGGGTADPPPGHDTCGASIAANHGHRLAINRADLDSLTERQCDITGSADHSHAVTLTPAQLAALKSGQALDLTSSIGFGHQHEISVRCV